MKYVKEFILIGVVFLMVGCSSVQISHKQIDDIRSAASKVLPTGAKVDVTTKSHFLAKPTLLISAHLLEGHSADETNPYVRGDYTTHERLTRLIRYRCSQILKSVVTRTTLPDASSITIQARHGVRQTYVGTPFGGTDVAMTIYQISISINEIKKQDWSYITEEEIMQLWKIDMNIIPSLDFQWVPF